MLFHTYEFVFLFAPISVLLFYLLRQFANGRLALLSAVLASLAFYAYWRADYVPVLLASIGINYAIGTFILRASGRWRLTATATGVALNLLLLGYFKYTAFAVLQLNELLATRIPVPSIILPLAVSFYTFQQISYLVDCYRRKMHDNDLLHYVFIVVFFPHLIAGPIVRMREIAPQFSGAMVGPILQNLCVGLALFVAGLAKKVLVADYFKSVSDPLFAAAQAGPIDCASAWVAALAYTLQLYFDFCGYSDMAIGLARMFGFRLAVNFLSPYQARNIADFWRRWNITLSRFLRDYLYIPLGGSRRGQARLYLNLLITMTLGGLWHGASWTFVAWGTYHGILLSIHRIWRQFRPPAPADAPWRRAVATATTFLCVVAGWVLFRAPDFATASKMLMAMAAVHTMKSAALWAHQVHVHLLLAAGLLFCWFMPNAYQVLYRFRPALILREQARLLRDRLVPYSFAFRTAEAVALSIALVACLYAMRGTVSQFLYFMF